MLRMSDNQQPASSPPAATSAPSPVPGTPPDPEQLLPAFQKLCEVIAKLRAPDGCPWDRVQTLETIKPYTLEETYELLEAIDSGNDADITEELGDVLLQVLLDSQIAADEGRFNLINVVHVLSEKMIRRHPHVFGDVVADTPEALTRNWHRIKGQEKPERESRLDGLPADLPALAKAARLQKKAADVGYDFPHRDMLFAKLQEEMNELQEELYEQGQSPHHPIDINEPHTADEPIADADRRDRVESELGDVLFVLANIARRWKINPEEALRRTNRKFTRRFQAIEAGLKRNNISIDDATLAEMEELYQQEKQREKAAQSHDN